MQEKGDAKKQEILVEVVYGDQSLVKCMEHIIELFLKENGKGMDA